MPEFTQLISDGSANLWLFLPSALLLGGLHGLEPGHSKTMMAAFIIAVNGTIGQAVLLGLSAAVSHSVIVWILGISALFWGDALIAEKAEPYFLFASGLIMLGIAAWMVWQTLRREQASHHHSHSHGSTIDAHAEAHAREIEARFASGQATTGQVVLFGFSGGLLPCAAAIPVLLICLQLDRIGLGIAMVSAFSIGLAIALVAVGVIAAWGVNHAKKRLKGFDRWARRLPYLSSLLIAAIGLFVAIKAWDSIH